MAPRRPGRHRPCQGARGAAGGSGRAPARRHAGCRRARARRRRGRPGALGPVCHGEGVPPRAACPGGLRAGRDRRDGAPRQGAPSTGGPIEDGLVEAPGVVFAGTTVSQLEPLAIAPSDRSLASRELVLAREGRRLERVLAERRALPHVEFAEISGQDDLLEDLAITPEPTLERIVSWLTHSGGPAVRLEVPDTADRGGAPGEGPRPVSLERPVQLGPAHLFGILSEPEEQVGAPAPTVVFLNVGRIPHPGPARFWVDLARSWSADGLRCLRVDLSGLGDSPTRPGRTELVEFPADAAEDLEDIRACRSRPSGGGPDLRGPVLGGRPRHRSGAARTDRVRLRGESRPGLRAVGLAPLPALRAQLEASTEASDRQARRFDPGCAHAGDGTIHRDATGDPQDPQRRLVDRESVVHDGESGHGPWSACAKPMSISSSWRARTRHDGCSAVSSAVPRPGEEGAPAPGGPARPGPLPSEPFEPRPRPGAARRLCARSCRRDAGQATRRNP